MNKDLDIQIVEALRAYLTSRVEDQVNYQKFYLYPIVTCLPNTFSQHINE